MTTRLTNFLLLPPVHYFCKFAMSFGFSMGDIVAVPKLGGKIPREFIDAPDQFRAICNEQAL
jgi:hypothetical protein